MNKIKCRGGGSAFRRQLKKKTYYPLHASETPPPFFFCHLRRQHKKEGLSPPLPHDHPIGHYLGRGWSWRTIEHSIPSHFAARFQWLFHIGAATRALGARSVDKGQIWGKFEANFGATPALGVISSPHRPPVHRSRRITVRYHVFDRPCRRGGCYPGRQHH